MVHILVFSSFLSDYYLAAALLLSSYLFISLLHIRYLKKRERTGTFIQLPGKNVPSRFGWNSQINGFFWTQQISPYIFTVLYSWVTHLGLLSHCKFRNLDLSKILAAFMRLQLHIMGIHYKVKGKLMPKDVCPVGVSGGHSSFLDSWICFAFLCSQDQMVTIMEDLNASKVLKRRKQIFLVI